MNNKLHVKVKDFETKLKYQKVGSRRKIKICREIKYMSKIRRKKKTTTLKLKLFTILLVLSLVLLLLFFILNYRTQTKVNETFKNQTNETSSTTITTSSQENISNTTTTNTSEVVIIRKAGRIQIVS